MRMEGCIGLLGLPWLHTVHWVVSQKWFPLSFGGLGCQDQGSGWFHSWWELSAVLLGSCGPSSKWGLSGVSSESYRIRASPLWPLILITSLLQIKPPWGLGLLTYECWGGHKHLAHDPPDFSRLSGLCRGSVSAGPNLLCPKGHDLFPETPCMMFFSCPTSCNRGLNKPLVFKS